MGERLDANVAGQYVLSQGGVFSSPRSVQSRPRKEVHPAINPSWWDTPSENNPYEGLTEEEALDRFASRWEQMRKVLLQD